MQSNTLLVLIGFSLLLFVLVLTLLILLVRSQDLPVTLLKQQLVENQKLRNQLRASTDPQLLASLNYATLPSSEQAEETDLINPNFFSALEAEEALASDGFSIGDLGNDLESAGWTSPVVKREGNESVAYDVS